MPSVCQGKRVTLSYIGTLDNGAIFDSTEERGPLEITIGSGEVFPALEQAILGMREGEARNVTLSAEQGYGPRLKENLIKVARGAFPAGRELRVGQRLSLDFSGGRSRVMRIAALDDNEVTLDGNHDLAGCELTFALRVDKIR